MNDIRQVNHQIKVTMKSVQCLYLLINKYPPDAAKTENQLFLKSTLLGTSR
jgi:hypothetical protein